MGRCCVTWPSVIRPVSRSDAASRRVLLVRAVADGRGDLLVRVERLVRDLHIAPVAVALLAGSCLEERQRTGCRARSRPASSFFCSASSTRIGTGRIRMRPSVSLVADGRATAAAPSITGALRVKQIDHDVGQQYRCRCRRCRSARCGCRSGRSRSWRAHVRRAVRRGRRPPPQPLVEVVPVEGGHGRRVGGVLPARRAGSPAVRRSRELSRAPTMHGVRSQLCARNHGRRRGPRRAGPGAPARPRSRGCRSMTPRWRRSSGR